MPNLPIIAHDPKPLQQYTVYEHDLRALASGSSEGQVYLNLTCALIPLGISGVVGFASTDATQIKMIIFHSVLTVFGIGVGVIFYILWRRSIKDKQPLLDSLLDAPLSRGPIGEDDEVVERSDPPQSNAGQEPPEAVAAPQVQS